MKQKLWVDVKQASLVYYSDNDSKLKWKLNGNSAEFLKVFPFFAGYVFLMRKVFSKSEKNKLKKNCSDFLIFFNDFLTIVCSVTLSKKLIKSPKTTN